MILYSMNGILIEMKGSSHRLNFNSFILLRNSHSSLNAGACIIFEFLKLKYTSKFYLIFEGAKDVLKELKSNKKATLDLHI